MVQRRCRGHFGGVTAATVSATDTSTAGQVKQPRSTVALSVHKSFVATASMATAAQREDKPSRPHSLLCYLRHHSHALHSITACHLPFEKQKNAAIRLFLPRRTGAGEQN
jgi:hypothetical protein